MTLTQMAERLKSMAQSEIAENSCAFLFTPSRFNRHTFGLLDHFLMITDLGNDSLFPFQDLRTWTDDMRGLNLLPLTLSLEIPSRRRHSLLRKSSGVDQGSKFENCLQKKPV